MRFRLIILAALGWVCAVFATSNNLTDVVTWDKYSLSVNGSRVFIKSVCNVSSLPGIEPVLTNVARLPV